MFSVFIHKLKRTRSRLMSETELARQSSSENGVTQKKITPEMDEKRAAILMMGMLRNDEDELTEQVKELLKSNKDYAKNVIKTNVEGWTPFHAFALRGCRKLLKLAIKCGVSVNFEMGQPEGLPGGCAAIHLASHRGDVSIIELLISNGAEVNKTDSNGKTPIFYASRASNTLAMKRLLRNGADMSTCDPDHKLAVEDLPSSSLNPFCFLPKAFGCGVMKLPKKS